MAKYEVTVTDCEEILGPDGHQLDVEGVLAANGRYWTKTYLLEAVGEYEAISQVSALLEKEPWSFSWDDVTIQTRKV